MTIQEIVADIHTKQPQLRSVFFVGCGASMSDLFPAKYSGPACILPTTSSIPLL